MQPPLSIRLPARGGSKGAANSEDGFLSPVANNLAGHGTVSADLLECCESTRSSSSWGRRVSAYFAKFRAVAASPAAPRHRETRSMVRARSGCVGAGGELRRAKGRASCGLPNRGTISAKSRRAAWDRWSASSRSELPGANRLQASRVDERWSQFNASLEVKRLGVVPEQS